MSKRFTYAKLHDDFPEHPKNASLSDAAFRVQVTGICYAHRLSTDGFVPTAVAHRWGLKGVKELVSEGLWSPAERGYVIHDYLEWNESKADIDTRSDSKRIAGAMGAASRWDGTNDGTSIATRVGVSASALVLAGGEEAKPPHQVSDGGFAEFYAAFPQKRARLAAEKAFRAACKLAPAEVIIAAAERFRDDPNLPGDRSKIPYPASWLNAGRWEDDPLPEQNGHRPSQHPIDRRVAEIMARRNGDAT